MGQQWVITHIHSSELPGPEDQVCTALIGLLYEI